MTYNGEIYNYKRLGKQFKFDYQTGKTQTEAKGKDKPKALSSTKTIHVKVNTVEVIDSLIQT